MFNLNFLRFLAATQPLGIEDPLLNPLLKKLEPMGLYDHFKQFNALPFPTAAQKKMHLYVHVPFCATICSFCHCHHLEVKGNQQLRRYTDLIVKQITDFYGHLENCRFGHFTILGGTASLLNVEDIQRIYDAALKHFKFYPGREFNFEGHPGSLSEAKLDLLKKMGVAKIHLGVQSLDEAVLKKINRFQSRESVQRCLANIKKRSIKCINADMVAGLPGQSIEGFLDDIRTLADWGVDLFNINPYSDISVMSASKGKVKPQEILGVRNEMIHKTKLLLKELGYANQGQRGYLKGGNPKDEDLDLENYPGGTLGLGLLSRSNLPGQLVFRTLNTDDQFQDARYVGYAIDQRYSMGQYAILHLLYGLDTKIFKKIFGADFESTFQAEIKKLNEAGVIVKSKGRYRYAGIRNLKELFDYFAYAQIFLGEKILDELKTVLAKKYDPLRRYGSKEDLLKVFENFEFAREYYQVGKKTLWL